MNQFLGVNCKVKYSVCVVHAFFISKDISYPITTIISQDSTYESNSIKVGSFSKCLVLSTSLSTNNKNTVFLSSTLIA